MPTATYIPLATLTLTGTDTIIDFQNIPSTYKDLILIINGSVNANSNIIFYYNNDSANGTAVWMTGNGSSASSSSINFMFAGTWNANAQSNAIVQVMDYSATDKHKTALVRSDQPGDTGTWALANRWASTNAINRLTLDPTGSNAFNSGSTFSLYGISG